MKKFTGLLFLAAALVGVGQSPDVFDLLRQGDIPAVQALIEKSPQLVDERDSDGNTPLHYAARRGDAVLVHFLIDKGAKLELAGAQAKTPLHVAAINDCREAVAVLLKRGAALETRDDYGRTALILCARERGQAATGRLLIEAGADVNAVDKFGSSALELAAWRGKSDFVDLLLEKGSRVPQSGPGWNGLLSQAASNGLTALFRRLTEKSQDLKAVDPSGAWLLHSAAAGGSAEIVGLLLEKGFDAARPDRFGWTPLHYAARDGRTDAARVLMERAAPINARTVMGQTAYNIARERKMEAAVALLAEKGADKSDMQFPVLKGDYLGQAPPGDQPALFGLGIISSIWGLHSTAVFSPDGSEVYWAPMISFPNEIYSRGGLLMMKRVSGQWTAPSWAAFSGPDSDDDVPFFSADGKRIYFISRRPLPGETEAGGEKIWFADRTAAGWSAPQPLDRVVNEHDMHWEFSLDEGKNLYFAGQAPDSLGRGDIYLARFVNGKYERPVNLGKPINSPGAETSPFIALDGSYLLFSRQYDLWVSFRGAGGTWAEPVKLGPEVNSPSVELCPIVTADGKYLFFLSQRDGESHAYWARADAISKARTGNDETKPVDQEAEKKEIGQELYEAVKAGDLDRVRQIVERDPRIVNIPNQNGETILFGAVLERQSEIIEYLISKGAEVNHENHFHMTPLHLACRRNLPVDIVRLLAEKGADVNMVSKYQGRPLDMAYENGAESVIRYLTSQGAVPTALEFETFELAEGLHRLAYPWGMRNNLLVSTGSDGALIVDTGFNKRALDVVRKIVSGFGRGNNIQYVINTHSNWDHVAGNGLAPSASAIISLGKLEELARQGRLTRSARGQQGSGGKSLAAPYLMKFNGEEIEIFPNPGLHSDDDILVHFRKAGVLCMGDLLLSQSCPAVREAAGYLEFLDRVLDVFPPGTTFVSGHGRDLNVAGLRNYRNDMAEMAEMVKKEYAAGRTAEDMIRTDLLKAYKSEYSQLDWLGPDSWIRTVVRGLPSAAGND